MRYMHFLYFCFLCFFFVCFFYFVVCCFFIFFFSFYFFFFFSSRRRHTRCSRDWSSDVCSSDLASIACSIQTKDSLLDLLFVGPETYCFTAGRGLGHTDHMLEVLAGVRPCRDRSEERRVGKECRSRRSAYD